MKRRIDKKVKLLVMGATDSGKSNLTGRLLHNFSEVDHEVMKEVEEEALQLGIETPFALFLDRVNPRNSRYPTSCISYDIKVKNREYAIYDAQGYRDYLRNICRRAPVSDASILAVSMDCFDPRIGFHRDTIEFSLVIHKMGIEHIIVCITKMDTNYSEPKFEEIYHAIKAELLKIGFVGENVSIIPVSASKGDNIESSSDNMKWWANTSKYQCGGMSLMDIIHSKIKRKEGLVNLPLRLPITDVYKISGIGTVPVGTVSSGILRRDMRLCISPKQILTKVKSVEVLQQPVDEVPPGVECGFNIKNVSVRQIRRGFVVGDVLRDPPREITLFEAEVVFLRNMAGRKILEGYCPVIGCGMIRTACKFVKFVNKKKKGSAEVIWNPMFLEYGDTAIVRMEPKRSCVLEPFRKYPMLGVFSVEDMRQVVAVGVIKNVKNVPYKFPYVERKTKDFDENERVAFLKDKLEEGEYEDRKEEVTELRIIGRNDSKIRIFRTLMI